MRTRIPRFIRCKIEGCDGNAHYSGNGACGYCCAHYYRVKKYGDPHRGGKITHKGEPMRYVLAHMHADGCTTWPFTSVKGYPIVNLRKRRTLVTRLVCEMVHGPAPSPEHEAAHTCGNGGAGCFSARHLYWATKDDNEADKLVHGTSNRGERCGSAKLTEHEVRQIRRLAGAFSYSEMADRYGVAAGTIGDIVSRRTWAWLP